jgi:lia operon protein LiaG
MSERNARAPRGALGKVVVVTSIVAAAALAAAVVTWFASGGLGGLRIGAAAGTAVDETKSLALQAVEQIEIRGVSEDIRILEGSGSAVEARLQGTVGVGDPAAIPHLAAEAGGTTAVFRVARERNVLVGPHWSNLVLEVRIPKSWKGRLEISTVSARVDLPDARLAGLSVQTVSGDVRLAGLEARDVTLHTTSGSIRAGLIQAASLEMSTVSGEIRAAVAAAGLRAHSTSGDVVVALPAGADFRLDARTVSGRVTCDFPIQVEGEGTSRARRALAGTVGAGRDSVSIDTVSGDIALRRE